MHDLDHPLGALVPPRGFRLTKRRAPRGVLNVYQAGAGPVRKRDERTGRGELRVKRSPVERGRARVVLCREEGGGR